MEPTQNFEKDNEFKNLKRVTSLSKYASLSLFIALPFIGAYIGYKHSPEKIIEKTTTIEQGISAAEDSVVNNHSSRNMIDGSTRVVINSLPVDSGSIRGGFPSEFQYYFDNGLYSVSFDIPEYVLYSDQYADPKKSLIDSFSVHFSRYIEGDGEEFFMNYNVHHKDYCRLSLCELHSSSTAQFAGREWESLGSYEYCDVGECGGSDYVYRRQVGDLVEYLELNVPIETALQNDQDIQKVVSSLHFLVKSND